MSSKKPKTSGVKRPKSDEDIVPTSYRKKIDDRVWTLVDNGIKTKHRTFFVVIGDRGRNQIPNLHNLLRKGGKGNPTILWTYKHDLAIHSAGKKRRQKINRGEKMDPLSEGYEAWLATTTIRYCFYKDTYKILGNTFGMLVIQDFETITPNLLARSVETVEGGGIVVLLIQTLSSLRALYTMTMDVHSRYRTEKYQHVTPRFNERFLLSFSDLGNFLSVDDELNVAPFTSNVHTIQPVDTSQYDGVRTQRERDLVAVQEALKDNPIIGPLVKMSRTADQAKLVMDLMAVVVEKEKSMRTTVVVTAARGRGKSAALGIAVAGAIQQGFSNIFVTAPSPENLKTFFFFVAKALEEMNFKEKEDFEIHQSTNVAFNKAVVRINIFKDHRQTVQYISPQDSLQFAQAELVVVDEAAAIPLPLVEKMFGPYLFFMSSTVNGYEGTGRSLSLKLISRLRQEKANTQGIAPQVAQADALHNPRNISSHARIGGGRELVELQLTEPIRYGEGDPVERWLHVVCCLDCSIPKKGPASCPHPDSCELYYVNRDTLFSYHKVSEELLQRMMALYVSSHYKNQPDDLQLMSDAPAHHLFLLLGPLSPTATTLPEILCVLQVVEEGDLKENTVEANFNSGIRPRGDLVPYTLAQQFQEPKFGSLCGMRVVRIAVNPDYHRMKYGSRALHLLHQYYNGDMVGEGSESFGPSSLLSGKDTDAKEEENAKVLTKRSRLPHLLQPLANRPLPQESSTPQYLSVSFGVTLPLYEFWKTSGYTPLYIRQAANDLTAEHSLIMVRVLDRYSGAAEWLPRFQRDFHSRFLSLLGSVLRTMPMDLALSVALDTTLPHNPLLRQANSNVPGEYNYELKRYFVDGVPQLVKEDLETLGLSEADIRRLSAYSRMLVDIQVVMDLLPVIAKLHFGKRMILAPDGTSGVLLNLTQSAVLLGVGLQMRTLADVAVVQLELGTTQASTLLIQIVQMVIQFLEKCSRSFRRGPMLYDNKQ